MKPKSADMKKRQLASSLLVLGLIAHSLNAQIQTVVESSKMLDVLKRGQNVAVREMAFGYDITILAPHSLERTNDTAEQQRAKIGEQLEERREADPRPGYQRGPARSLAAEIAKIGSVHPDYIVLRYSDGRERRIATRVIAEITRDNGEQESTTASSDEPDASTVRQSKPNDTMRTEVGLEGGYVEPGMNEISIVSTIDDPPGLRLGVRREKGWGRSLGKFSFNAVRPDRVQDECVLIQGKLDERFPQEDLVGEYVFFLRTPPGGGDEGGMVRVLTLQHDRIVAHVPVVLERGSTPIPDASVRP